MINPAAFSLTGLLLALLRRWLALWSHGAPPARFVALAERTEAELANAIRATLREDGVAFPTLDDPAFLVWFKQAYPCSDDQAVCGKRPCDAPRNGRLDRRLPAGQSDAGQSDAGWKPAVRQARAPP